MSEEAARSRVLVVGATGRLGGSLVRASLAAGHPTFALIRPHHFALPDSAPLKPLAAAGATILKGSLDDYPSLLEAVRQVDVVICAVPTKHALEQKPLIRAIKEAGCVKRFIPAEFGVDHTKVQICDMDHGFYEKKAEIRRLIESEDIPHTYIYCNFLMRYLLPSLVQPGLDAPPRDEVTIFGGGDTKGLVILLLSNLLSDTWNVKCFFHVLFFSLKEDFVSAGIFVEEGDVAKFTVCTIEDPRTLNMTLYLRPPGNIYSLNELVSLWETKINKCLKKIHITEEQLLKNIQNAPFPLKMDLIFIYSAFVKGDHTYFEIDSRSEGTQLYPDVKYTTVSEYLDTLV
ncbi:probable pinoresinol-lariciresinol reductase 3 isoform X1 [Triticum aestivum]|uniref:probable pinoresinol-lariciresinol reductase 3 isoform X1 n=1 Tax=Triticum aestivum TaxID=4565 RepID=UPI001D030B8F|nr:probable pinoresinol-lariciresinol reductase 3 isoform X1 [Triticum aestivum]